MELADKKTFVGHIYDVYKNVHSRYTDDQGRFFQSYLILGMLSELQIESERYIRCNHLNVNYQVLFDAN